MVRGKMTTERAPAPKGDDPRSEILELVALALELADEHGFARAGVYLDQALQQLRGDVNPTR